MTTIQGLQSQIEHYQAVIRAQEKKIQELEDLVEELWEHLKICQDKTGAVKITKPFKS